MWANWVEFWVLGVVGSGTSQYVKCEIYEIAVAHDHFMWGRKKRTSRFRKLNINTEKKLPLNY